MAVSHQGLWQDFGRGKVEIIRCGKRVKSQSWNTATNFQNDPARTDKWKLGDHHRQHGNLGNNSSNFAFWVRKFISSISKRFVQVLKDISFVEN